MAKPGPRRDLDATRILDGADGLLAEHGTVEKISLRMLAAHIGVTANAIYTYFPTLDAVWHELADRALGRLHPLDVLDNPCPHCAVLELAHRAGALFADDATTSLLRHQPVMGVHSFELSETVMTLCEGALIDPRNAHDLIMGWFWGSAALNGDGWTAATDAIRASGEGAEQFPRIFGRAPSLPDAQAAAILRGLGIECRA